MYLFCRRELLCSCMPNKEFSIVSFCCLLCSAVKWLTMVKHFMQKKYIGLFMLQLQMLLKHSEVVTEALKILSWKMEVAHWWNYVSPPKTFSPTERFHCIWKELVLELTLQHSPRPSSTQRHVHGSSPSAICSLPCSASSLCQCLSAVLVTQLGECIWVFCKSSLIQLSAGWCKTFCWPSRARNKTRSREEDLLSWGTLVYHMHCKAVKDCVICRLSLVY